METPISCAAAAGCLKTCELLRDHDACLDPLDKQKHSPLMAAASNGHSKVVKYFIESNAKIDFIDAEGNNCLDLAIKHDHQDVALEIIKSAKWRIALMNFTFDNNLKTTPMRKLIRKMPEVATEVFNNCIEVQELQDEKDSKKKRKHTHAVKFDYEFIDDLYYIDTWSEMKERQPLNDNRVEDKPYTRSQVAIKKNHPLMIMVESSREELLSHPLTQSLIKHKWIRFGRPILIFYSVIHAIFAIGLTIHIIENKAQSKRDNGNFSSWNVSNDYQDISGCDFSDVTRQISFISLLIVNVLGMMFKLHRVAWLMMEIFKDLQSDIELLLYVTLAVLLVDIWWCRTILEDDVHWMGCSVAVVFAWTNMALTFQTLMPVGNYIVMFRRILITFFKCFIIFVMLIIAFATGFFCLLQNQTSFSTVPYSLIRTAVMMNGEVGYSDIFFGDDENIHFFKFIFYIVFLYVMHTVIMNMLVGLAVSDINSIKKKARLEVDAMKINYVLDAEVVVADCLVFAKRYFKKNHVQKYTAKENAVAATQATEELKSEELKKRQKMLRKMNKVKSELMGIKKDIANMQKMLRSIMKAQQIPED